MATQGIVSMVRDGEVVLKFVAGCDGMKAEHLANILRVGGVVPSLEQAYELATAVGFGSTDSLVVLDPTDYLYKGYDEVGRLYRSTFNDPNFNPRWKRGTADYTEVVDL